MLTFNEYTGEYENDSVGAEDALEVLGVGAYGQGWPGVGGVDIVGAMNMLASNPNLAGSPMGQALARQVQPMLATTPYAYPPQQSFTQQAHAAHTAKQEQLARAGSLPAIVLGVDSGSTLITAGSSSTIATGPSVPVRITKFTVASSAAPFFNINEISIARLNLLAGSSGVPAENYIPNAETPPIEAPILPAGSQVVVVVENLDGSSHRFRGAFSCLDLTPPAARIV